VHTDSLDISRLTSLLNNLALTYVHGLRELLSLKSIGQQLSLRMRRCSESRLSTDSGASDGGCLGSDLGGEGSFKGGRASLDGNALLLSTEATVGVGGDANGVLLGEALGVLGSSLSLGEVNSLEDGDGSLDLEGSVLGLDGEGGVSGLSAFAAVGLADLVVLGVGDGAELSNLAGFGVLLVALGDTGTETWELAEVAWAFNVKLGEVEVAKGDVAGLVS
jgi:hypothetical protein